MQKKDNNKKEQKKKQGWQKQQHFQEMLEFCFFSNFNIFNIPLVSSTFWLKHAYNLGNVKVCAPELSAALTFPLF